MIVDPCVVTSFTAPGTIDLEYDIGSETLYYEFNFPQSPCVYEATYTVTFQNNTEVPNWIVQNSRVATLTVDTDELDDEDEYPIRITAVLDNLYNWFSSDN